MRVMILGASGMVGHQLVEHFRIAHEVMAVYRGPQKKYLDRLNFVGLDTTFNVDCVSPNTIENLIAVKKPQFVINCVGIVKQSRAVDNKKEVIELNSVLPHRLNSACEQNGSKLIQISTDCVFSGMKGLYVEEDQSDANDFYGRTKYLGEVTGGKALTIRTSKIGLEQFGAHGLVEWFMSQKGKIKGFKKAIFSGVTTIEVARILENTLEKFSNISGVYHISSEPISKYDLLRRLQEVVGKWDVEIEPEENFECDRSLNGNKFNQLTGYKIPNWNSMLSELGQQIKKRADQNDFRK
jgi:dTDP-4-dehydrorhamnose reductase